MRKVFYFFLAAVTMTLAGCGDGNEPGQGTDLSVELEVTKLTAQTAEISITPAAANPYLWANVNQKFLDNRHFSKLEDCVNYLLSSTTYEKMETAGQVLKGNQTIPLTDLTENTIYYFVVFRVNKEFKLSGEVYSVRYIPRDPDRFKDGILPGKFTVDDQGKQVQFSQGNLQATYNGSRWTWAFATNEWEYIGDAIANNAITGNGQVPTNGTVDLFGWSTDETYYGINNDKSQESYSGDFVDWGNNPISNGGNQPKLWRTLTKDEWKYLFHERTNADQLFGLGSVNGVKGTILLPDDWVKPSDISFTPSTALGLSWNKSYYQNSNKDNFSHNTYSLAQWTAMEEAGAVFLPAAGFRNHMGTGVFQFGLDGHYWSATLSGTLRAHYLSFNLEYLDPTISNYRYSGRSVRLVHDK